MYRLSPTGRHRRSTLHPDLQLIVDELIQYVDFTLICSHRTEEEQNEAYEQNVSQVKWPNSKHNKLPAEAMDLAPYFAGLGLDWLDTHSIANLIGRVQQIADQLLKEGRISHSIRWGGDWDRDGRTRDQKFMDWVHVELVKLPE